LFALVQPHDAASDEVRFNYERAAIPGEISHGEPLTVAGVMGAYLVFWPRARIHSLAFVVLLPVLAALVLGIWFVLQFATECQLERRLGRPRDRVRGRRDRRAGAARRQWSAALGCLPAAPSGPFPPDDPSHLGGPPAWG
jgi:hypothetical protein